MSKRIITIGRQFGSNGRLIGQQLADRLGINCYDKKLIKLASEHTDIPYDQLKLVDEKREKPWRYQVDEDDNLEKQYRYCHIDEVLYNLESKIIKEIAANEDCIFIGRCADYVLEDEKRCKHIFIHAPLEVRKKTVMERYQLDEKKALSLLKRIDKDRGYYYNYYTDRNWNDINNYHLALDSSAFSMTEIVDILEKVFNSL